MIFPSLRRRLSATAAALVVGSLALTACGDAADETTTTATDGNGGDNGAITITGVPAEEATALVSKFELLMEVISEETGKEVEFSSSTDYAAVIEALVAGQADMAIGSPFSYVRASKAGAELEPLGPHRGGGRRAGLRLLRSRPSGLRHPGAGRRRGAHGLLRRPGFHLRLPLPVRRYDRRRPGPGGGCRGHILRLP